MPTAFLHRLIVVCPAARLAALGTWWAANLDPTDDASTWPALNPSGRAADPVTHRWCSIALTETQLRAVLVKVCQLAAVIPPTAGTWNGWTRQQKIDWLAATRAQLLTATGIWLDLSANDGAWNGAAPALAAAGVQRVAGS
jgi:hypothetical protein